MKHLASLAIGSLLAVCFVGAGCGGAGTISTGDGGHGGANTGGLGGATSSASGGGGSVMTTPDPNKDGPYQIAEIDDVIASVAGGDTNIPVHCAHPISGPTAGQYPIVVVGHGMQLPASQYYSYVRRLASFGYVALTVDFPASLFGVDNNKSAKDLLAGIDWAKGKPELHADGDTAGVTGHSLGGKTALLAATLDPRVKASIVLDPVDGGGPQGCNPPGCVDVSMLMPNLHIPTGFVGETTDASGGFMPCAPAADNFQTFYAGTNSPSLALTVTGANHMSFLDDAAGCGLVCSFCQMATAPNAQVNALANAFVVAFYERWLRGDTAYDTYLTGMDAQARYVTTGQATIESK